MPNSARLTEIRDNLAKHFNLDELRSLCVDLNVDFDELRGETKTAKVDALLERLDHRNGIPQLIAKLAQLRPNIDWHEIEITADAEPPFKGLLYFDVTDAPLFFGREQLTAQLIARLLPSPAEVQTSRFLAVIGASGSGKSSLARAGVVATLWRDSQQHGITPKHTFILTPTDRPLRELAAKLTRDEESTRATTTLMDDLRADSRSLDLFIAKRPLAADQKILIVVDQFEELFTACKEEAERKAFIDNLLEAVSGAHNSPVLVLLTLRADFYEKCAPYANLRALLEQRQTFIGPMSEAELRTAIQQPALQAGLSFEPGLVALLLRDVGVGTGAGSDHSPEPGALPLLSHALLETWRNRRERTLTLQGYTDSGGVRGAIAKTADATLAALAPADQTIAKRIFLALTELGEGTQDTRRRAVLSDLTRNPEDAPRVNAMLKTLADARLITTERETTEVAHEALIRYWGQLRGWLDEDRTGLRVQRQLEADAREWLRSNRDADVLYRGAKLAQAQEWAAQHADDVDALTREYLDAAQAAADEYEAQRQRELAKERARARVARLVAVGLSLLTVVALVASALAFRASRQVDQANRDLTDANQGLLTERNRAEANAATAQAESRRAVREEQKAKDSEARTLLQQKLLTSKDLAAAAIRELDNDPERAILLAKYAQNLYPTFESQDALRKTLLEPRVKVFASSPNGFSSASCSPDEKLIVTTEYGQKVAQIWSVISRTLVMTLEGHTANVNYAEFSKDGKYVVTASDDKTARVWDVTTGKSVSTLAGHLGEIKKASFSNDGRQIVTASSDRTAIVWGRESGNRITLVSGHTDEINDARFSPDDLFIATASKDRTVRLWNVDSGQEVRVLTGHKGSVNSVSFSPNNDGNLATASSDGIVAIWSLNQYRTLATFQGHGDRVTSVRFSPDSKRLVSSGFDYTARIWDVSSRKELVVLKGSKSVVVDAVFSPSGEHVITSGYDGKVRIWDAEQGSEYSLPCNLLKPCNAVESLFDTPALILADGEWNLQRWSDGVSAKVEKPVAITDLIRGFQCLMNAPICVLATIGNQNVQLHYFGIKSDSIERKDTKWLNPSQSESLKAVVSPNGNYVAIAHNDSSVTLWNASTLTQTWIAKNYSLRVNGLAFSRDERFLAAAGEDGIARIWSVATGEVVRVFERSPSPLNGVVFSSNGQLVMILGSDNVARIWDAKTGREKTSLVGHSDSVISGAFSSDDRLVVTGSSDHTARIWDANSGKMLSILQGHISRVVKAQFIRGNKQVMTVDIDGTARLHAVNMSDLIALANTRTERDLTCDERVQFLAEPLQCATELTDVQPVVATNAIAALPDRRSISTRAKNEGNLSGPQPTPADEMIFALNQLRTNKGLPPLKQNSSLQLAAQNFAEAMGRRNFFSHNDPDEGCNRPWDRMKQAGYVGYRTAAENIAGAYDRADTALEAFINSPSHYDTLINPNLREVGVGFYMDPLDSSNVRVISKCPDQSTNNGPYMYYWVQDFGARWIGSVPNLPVIINAEAFSTTQREVSLYVYGGEWKKPIWAKWMSFSDDGNNWSPRQPWISTTTILLTEGTGYKTIYVKLANENSVEQIVSDKIYLDQERKDAPSKPSETPTVSPSPLPINSPISTPLPYVLQSPLPTATKVMLSPLPTPKR